MPEIRRRRFPRMGLLAVTAGLVVLGIAVYASGRDGGGSSGGGGASDQRRTPCATVTRQITRSVPVQATVRAVEAARGQATVTEQAEAPLPDGSGHTRVSSTVRATATLPQSSTVTVRRKLRRRGRGSARVCVEAGGRVAARRQASAQALAGAVERANRMLARAVPGARRRVGALATERARAAARQNAAAAEPRADARAAAGARRSASKRAQQRADQLARERGAGAAERRPGE